MIKKIYFCLLVAVISSCSQKNNTETIPFKALINLEDSIKLLRTLITQNKLGQALEKHDPEQLDLLLNNYSPAHMAFEAEVLSTTIPLVLVYYFKNSAQEQRFLQQLDQLVLDYPDSLKCVIIDIDRLFSLAQDAEIETVPTIVFSKDREMLEKITDNITIDSLRKKIVKHQTNCS